MRLPAACLYRRRFARYALYAQNIEVFVAPTWDTGERWLSSMRHIATEGGTWEISTARQTMPPAVFHD
jgi:hypothetical protein